MESIGEKILHLRKKRGISQEDLGYELGVSRQTISKWESNAMSPNIENVKALSLYFEVHAGYFFDCVTVPDTNSELAISDNKRTTKVSKITIILSVLLMIIFVISLIATIVLKGMVFTTVEGYRLIKNNNIDKEWFFLSLIITVVSLIVEFVLIAFIIKKKCKSKVLLTRCK